MILVISIIDASYTPCVEGYVIISAERLSLCKIAFSRKSSTSILPSSVALVTTTFIPAITALAGFVPCAEDGIKQMFL